MVKIIKIYTHFVSSPLQAPNIQTESISVDVSVQSRVVNKLVTAINGAIISLNNTLTNVVGSLSDVIGPALGTVNTLYDAAIAVSNVLDSIRGTITIYPSLIRMVNLVNELIGADQDRIVQIATDEIEKCLNETKATVFDLTTILVQELKTKFRPNSINSKVVSIKAFYFGLLRATDIFKRIVFFIIFHRRWMI